MVDRSSVVSRGIASVLLIGLLVTGAIGANAEDKVPPAKPTDTASVAAALVDPNFKPNGKAVSMEETGMWVDKDGNPTDHINNDGTLDWFSFSGYRRYHSECHVCHGPDGMGSSYAPALKDSVQTLSYADFLGTVAAGRQNVTTSQTNVMPSFGDNKNVMCYINDIYIYLRARGNGDLDRARPEKHTPKPKVYADAETACVGF